MGISPKSLLHTNILVSAGEGVKDHNSVNDFPFNIELSTLGNITFYAFNLVRSPAQRPAGEYKIQLALPQQHRRERVQLTLPPETFSIICGFNHEEGIFVFWDAYAHQSFTYLQCLLVRGDCVWLAQAKGLSTCKRRLRGGRGIETVVACRADFFLEGVQSRMHFSARRIVPSTESLWTNTL